MLSLVSGADVDIDGFGQEQTRVRQTDIRQTLKWVMTVFPPLTWLSHSASCPLFAPWLELVSGPDVDIDGIGREQTRTMNEKDLNLIR